MAEKQRFKFRINGNEPEETNKAIDNEQPSQGEVAERVRKVEEKKDKLPFEIKYIPRQKIKENKKNHYPKEKMESLQESILQFGLQQNLSVIYVTEEDSFVLEAGHRRTQAIDNLIQEFANYEDEEDSRYQLYLKNVHEYKMKGYPCRVTAILSDSIQYDYEDEDNLDNIPEEVIDSEIRLIATNEEVRRADTATQALNVARLKKLYERKNLGKPCIQKINIDNKIAEDLNISVRQVKNYKSIDKLIPQLKEAFIENQISLSDGMNFSKLTVEEQEMILLLLKKGHKVSKEEIETLKKKNSDLENEIKEKSLLIEQINNAKEEKNDQELEKLKSEILKLKKQKTETLQNMVNQTNISYAEWNVDIQCDNLKKALISFREAVENLNAERISANEEQIIIAKLADEKDIKNLIEEIFLIEIN